MNTFMLPTGDLSAIREWEMITRQILNQAQAQIDTFARVQRITAYNDLDTMIDSAEPGATLGDSGLTKEQAVAVRAVLASFGVWLSTPLPNVPTPGETITPIALMSRRG